MDLELDQYDDEELINEKGRKRIRHMLMNYRFFFKKLIPKKNQKLLALSTLDCINLLIFFGIGIWTRFFRIQSPPNVVFDEVRFGSFINNYIRGEYFIDIHPPLGKLIIAGISYLAGYRGEFNFEALGESQYPSMYYVTLRLIPAFFGALCVPLMYLTVRVAGYSVYAAFTAGVLLCSDLVMIVCARLILIDSILHFFCCLSLFMIYIHDIYENMATFLLQCVCLGLVATCKYNSGGIVLFALAKQFQYNEKNKNYAFYRCGIICFIVFLIHYIVFDIHFSALPYMPNERKYIPDCVLKTLVDKADPDWSRRLRSSPLIWRMIVVIYQMHIINMNVGYKHPYHSPWWSWPLCLRSWLLCWNDSNRYIIYLGNVLMYYPLFFILCGCIIHTILNTDNDLKVLILGYLCSYLPFALVPRELYNYHYVIPLIFSIITVVCFIEKVFPESFKSFLFCFLMLFACFGYFIWCPVLYAMTTPDLEFLVWNSRWKY